MTGSPCRRLTVLVVSAALTAGCSASPSQPDAATRILLRNDMTRVAAAAASNDYPAVTAALSTLTADATSAHAAAHLSSAELTKIRAAATTVRAAALAGQRPRPAPTTHAPRRAPSLTHAPPSPHSPAARTSTGHRNGGGGDNGGDGGD